MGLESKLVWNGLMTHTVQKMYILMEKKLIVVFWQIMQCRVYQIEDVGAWVWNGMERPSLILKTLSMMALWHGAED